mgnify:CR=1 FL=1
MQATRTPRWQHVMALLLLRAEDGGHGQGVGGAVLQGSRGRILNSSLDSQDGGVGAVRQKITAVDVLDLELPAYSAVYNGNSHSYPTDQLTNLEGVKSVRVMYIGTLPNGKPYELPSPPVDAGNYTARLQLTAGRCWEPAR